MTTAEIIQLVTGLIGSLGFGVLFNIRGVRLLAAALGGFLSWGAFLVLSRFIEAEAFNYFLVAAATSLYAEVGARVLKTPAPPLAVTALIPLIPGGSLYYTMAYAFESDLDRFLEKAVSTLALSCALALGILLAAALSRILFRKRKG